VRLPPIGHAIRAEIERWPGVSAEFDRRRKHPVVFIRYGSQERMLTFPGTAGDYRAVKNKIADIRRMLRGWGAVEAGAR